MPGNFRRRHPIAEMNLIPLIDISLILVIIFMVLTPVLVQSQLTVRLPVSKEGAPAAAETALRVQIGARGEMTLDGRPVSLAGLERELTLRFGRSAQKSLLVQADRTVPIESVVGVLDVAKRLGVGKLGIGVTPK
ncbi:MAG TPA: biopolymer transporter ExbD [Elusimicrobiota bacterium]|nr:biopolymer transporter ExbD [Elusimicrobiota bacterium]